MPLESPPERGALWLENWILSSTLAATPSQQINYPATSLLNPLRGDRWWSADLADVHVPFDLGTIRTPTCFGLIDSNLDGGSFVGWIGADDAAFTVNVVAWYMPLYTQDPVGQLLKWYPGTPTFGSIGSSTNPADAASARGRRFWRISILPTFWSTTYTAEDHYRIGVPWMGQYVAIRPWDGTRIRPKDPSLGSLSYGRSKWSDPLTPYREAEVTTSGLTPAAAFDLEAAIRAQGSTKHALLDVFAFSTDASVKRGGAMYGTFAEDPCDVQFDSPEMNTLSLSFEEASG